jgi:hypothetical protein
VILGESAQNGIDKALQSRKTCRPGQFNGRVDRGVERDPVEAKNLIGPDPEDVLDGPRKARETLLAEWIEKIVDSSFLPNYTEKNLLQKPPVPGRQTVQVGRFGEELIDLVALVIPFAKKRQADRSGLRKEV